MDGLGGHAALVGGPAPERGVRVPAAAEFLMTADRSATTLFPISGDMPRSQLTRGAKLELSFENVVVPQVPDWYLRAITPVRMENASLDKIEIKRTEIRCGRLHRDAAPDAPKTEGTVLTVQSDLYLRTRSILARDMFTAALFNQSLLPRLVDAAVGTMAMGFEADTRHAIIDQVPTLDDYCQQLGYPQKKVSVEQDGIGNVLPLQFAGTMIAAAGAIAEHFKSPISPDSMFMLVPAALLQQVAMFGQASALSDVERALLQKNSSFVLPIRALTREGASAKFWPAIVAGKFERVFTLNNMEVYFYPIRTDMDTPDPFVKQNACEGSAVIVPCKVTSVEIPLPDGTVIYTERDLWHCAGLFPPFSAENAPTFSYGRTTSIAQATMPALTVLDFDPACLTAHIGGSPLWPRYAYEMADWITMIATQLLKDGIFTQTALHGQLGNEVLGLGDEARFASIVTQSLLNQLPLDVAKSTSTDTFIDLPATIAQIQAAADLTAGLRAQIATVINACGRATGNTGHLFTTRETYRPSPALVIEGMLGSVHQYGLLDVLADVYYALFGVMPGMVVPADPAAGAASAPTPARHELFGADPAQALAHLKTRYDYLSVLPKLYTAMCTMLAQTNRLAQHCMQHNAGDPAAAPPMLFHAGKYNWPITIRLPQGLARRVQAQEAARADRNTGLAVEITATNGQLAAARAVAAPDPIAANAAADVRAAHAAAQAAYTRAQRNIALFEAKIAGLTQALAADADPASRDMWRLSNQELQQEQASRRPDLGLDNPAVNFFFDAGRYSAPSYNTRTLTPLSMALLLCALPATPRVTQKLFETRAPQFARFAITLFTRATVCCAAMLRKNGVFSVRTDAFTVDGPSGLHGNWPQNQRELSNAHVSHCPVVAGQYVNPRFMYLDRYAVADKTTHWVRRTPRTFTGAGAAGFTPAIFVLFAGTNSDQSMPQWCDGGLGSTVRLPRHTDAQPTAPLAAVSTLTRRLMGPAWTAFFDTPLQPAQATPSAPQSTGLRGWPARYMFTGAKEPTIVGGAGQMALPGTWTSAHPVLIHA